MPRSWAGPNRYRIAPGENRLGSAGWVTEEKTSNILLERLFLQVTLRQRRRCIERDARIGPELTIHAELDIVLHQKPPIVARAQFGLQRQHEIAVANAGGAVDQ